MYFVLICLITALSSAIGFSLSTYRFVKQKKFRYLFSAFTFLILSVTAILTALVYQTGSFLLPKALESFKPRSGIQIYQALFNHPNSCVNVVAFQDQNIPKIDYAIYLHFKTCAEEIKRINHLHAYKTYKISTTGNNAATGPAWFNPGHLGDSIIIMETTFLEGKSGQIIYLNTAQNEGFCMDYLD